jgi:Flp pilus assembly protein TadD
VKRLGYLWLKLQAMAWLVFGRNARALAVFDRMVRHFPEAAYPRASRAHLHAQAGRHAAALADHDALLKREPGDARTWFNKGFVLELTGQMDEALTAFRRATELSPTLDRAWYGQGLVLIRLQRFDEAVAALKRNTELQPMSPHGWYQLEAARRGGEDHPPSQGLRAEGGCAAGARDRAAGRRRCHLSFTGSPARAVGCKVQGTTQEKRCNDASQ